MYFVELNPKFNLAVQSILLTHHRVHTLSQIPVIVLIWYWTYHLNDVWLRLEDRNLGYFISRVEINEFITVNLFNKHTTEASQMGGNAEKVREVDFGVCLLLIQLCIDRMLLGRNPRDFQTLPSLQDLLSLHLLAECPTPTLLCAARTGKQS